MNEAEVRRCAANCRFTDHARKEMDEEPLGRIHVEEVLQIIEPVRSSNSILMIPRMRAVLFWDKRDPEGLSISSVRRFSLRSD